MDIRPELLSCHKIVYPADAVMGETPLMVVQGSIKNEPTLALNHLVYTCAEENGKKRYFTIFRSRALEEALNFCRRCDECRVLFYHLGLLNLMNFIFSNSDLIIQI